MGDVLASVSLPEFAKLRSQLLEVFIMKKTGAEAMPKFLNVMWYICSVTVLRGTHWVS